MRPLRIIEHISLDGVIQAAGGPDEESEYPYGGWAAPYYDEAVGEGLDLAQGDRFDLVLGRKTYDIFAGFWPKMSGPMADTLNAATKYVATHRPDSLAWGPAQSLGGDISKGVADATAQDGPDLVVLGSSTLTPFLLEAGLVDQVILLVFPVLLGSGEPFFSDIAKPCALELVSSKSSPSGVLMSTYRPVGPLRTGNPGKDLADAKAAAV